MTTTRKSLIGIALATVLGIIAYRMIDSAQHGKQAEGKSTADTPTQSSSTGRDSGDRGKTYANSAFFKPRLDEEGKRNLQQNPGEILSAHDQAGWSTADDDLLVAWASQDPAAALAWINGGERSVVHAQLLGAVAAGILLHDGKEAMERFLQEHREDSQLRPKDQEALMRYLFYHLGREDTIDAAMEMLGDNNDSVLTGALIGGIEGAQNQSRAIDYMEAKGHPVAMDYWSFQEQIDSDPRFWADWAVQRESNLLGDVLQSWTRENPDQVRDWIDRNIPQNDKRRNEIEEMYKIQTTPLPPDEEEE